MPEDTTISSRPLEENQFDRLATLMAILNGTTLQRLDDIADFAMLDFPGAPPSLAATWHAAARDTRLAHLPADTVVCLEVTYGSHFAFMRPADINGIAVLGPYRLKAITLDEARKQAAHEQTSAEEREQLARYLATLPILTKAQTVGVMSVLAGIVSNRDVTHPVVTLALDISTTPEDDREHQEDLSLPDVVDPGQVNAIDTRYRNENALLDAVADGDRERAFTLLGTRKIIGLQRNDDEQRDQKNSLIILNTLLRERLEHLGIRPYFIDAISSRWGLRIEATEDPSELEGLAFRMVDDYCRSARSYSLADYSPNVRAALQHIHLHLADESLALKNIAANLKVNPTYLSHQFNQEVGMSVPEYVSRTRISRAQTMLRRDKDASISSIAHAVGFSDPAYFSRCFKKITGCSPSEWRHGT